MNDNNNNDDDDNNNNHNNSYFCHACQFRSPFIYSTKSTVNKALSSKLGVPLQSRSSL